MGWVGVVGRACGMVCGLATYRYAHGSWLAEHQSVQNWIADSAAEMQAGRLMTLNAAWKMDTQGVLAARQDIAMIKYFGAKVLHDVIDRAVQAHGSLGYSTDLPLEAMYRYARAARIYDGPDEVHRASVARQVLRGYEPPADSLPSEHVPTRRAAAREKIAHLLERELRTIAATCALVTKVHREAVKFAAEGYTIVLVGHAGHEEVEGTMGEAPDNIVLIENEADVDTLEVDDPERVAYISQTTLSVDETRAIILKLRERFPAIVGPRTDDICYATTNRQAAVKQLARECDLVLVIGSRNSSNSNRLVEVAREHGADSHLIDNELQVREEGLRGKALRGLPPRGSAPEGPPPRPPGVFRRGRVHQHRGAAAVDGEAARL